MLNKMQLESKNLFMLVNGLVNGFILNGFTVNGLNGLNG